MNEQAYPEESASRFPLFFFISLLIFGAGCSQPEQNETVIARVNDQSLTMEMIRANVDTVHPLSQSDIQQYANRWVTNEILFQEAQQRGYDGSEQIRQKVAEARKQLSIAELLEKEVYALAENSIRPEDIAEYFQSHSSEFILRESLMRLSLAVFREFEPANRFHAAVLTDAGWNNTVLQFRSDESKGLMSYSDSLFFTQSSLYPPELWKVASALGHFEVSFPVQTSVGFIVIQSRGQFKINSNAPVQYVEPEIRNRLAMERRQQRYQQFMQRLRTKHTVQMMITTKDPVEGNE